MSQTTNNQELSIHFVVNSHDRAQLQQEKCLCETLKTRLKRVAGHPILNAYLPQRAEFCLSLINDEEIQKLNKEYRGKDKPTDVLSFAQLEGDLFVLPPEIPVPLGDIMISLDTARIQAKKGALPRIQPYLKQSEWGLAEELAFLSLHGFLHLLGFDHEQEDEAEIMESLEAYLLKTLFPRTAIKAVTPNLS